LSQKLGESEEGLVFADIDLGLISVAKSVADPTGHYARPDVTRLLFNSSRSRAVEHFSSTEHLIESPTASADSTEENVPPIFEDRE